MTVFVILLATTKEKNDEYLKTLFKSFIVYGVLDFIISLAIQLVIKQYRKDKVKQGDHDTDEIDEYVKPYN